MKWDLGLSTQVQPDMEELTENAEEPDEEEASKQSVQKLGKLQYKVGKIIQFTVTTTKFSGVHTGCNYLDHLIRLL